MIEKDTVKLLRECDAGIKMGISSIDEVIEHVESKKFRKCLSACKEDHGILQCEVQRMLEEYRDTGKDPNPLAKSMSWIKTNVKLGIDNTDAAIADLITDGCDMGVKSLSRYLNQYGAADEASKNIAKQLIALEEKLAADIRQYL